LQLSEKAKNLLNKQALRFLESRGGAEHEFWKYKIAEMLKKQGYAVEFERKINEHKVDLVAVKNGETMAIEIETGKSDAEMNLRRDFEAGFKRVVCFVLLESLANWLREKFSKEVESGKLIIKTKHCF